jgi:hypothetical protein
LIAASVFTVVGLATAVAGALFLLLAIVLQRR